MQANNFVEILKAQGWTQDGTRYMLPSGQSATVFVSLDSETLTIDRVSALEVINTGVLSIATQRKERYATEIAFVRAIRLAPESK